jgi:subtilase family serine protease
VKFIPAAACFAACLAAVPASASVLRNPAMHLPAAGSATRPLTLAASRGTFAGAIAPGQSISLLIKIPGQHQAELDAFVASLQSPNTLSPRYLTPVEFGRYFGADPVAYARAIATLRSAGFTIDTLNENRTDIEVHAPASRVEAFFATPIDQRIDRGRVYFTARFEPAIPAALGAIIISGLDDYTQFHPLGLRGRSPLGFVRNAYEPVDIAAVYDLNPLYAKNLDGRGMTIANSTAGAASANDLALYQQRYNLPAVPLQSTPVGGALSTSCGRDCGNTESSLDADMASAVGRGAAFHQVVGHTASNHDFDLSYEYIVNKLGTTVHVVTTSWGLCEADFKGTKSGPLDESLLEQAVAEGQFWFSASGDNGSNDCDDGRAAVSVDFPGSSPYVISVGGTNVQAKTNSKGRAVSWLGETTWQYSNSDGASGGGVSIDYPKPAYQKGLTPNDGWRDVPDVALLADPENNGVYFMDNGGLSIEGGTSEASPMWAGFFAIIEQNKKQTHKPLVDPHVRLYAIGKNKAQYAQAFHDILSGNNGVPLGDDEYYPGKSWPGFNAGTGFDLATGWGSFNGANLLKLY